MSWVVNHALWEGKSLRSGCPRVPYVEIWGLGVLVDGPQGLGIQKWGWHGAQLPVFLVRETVQRVLVSVEILVFLRVWRLGTHFLETLLPRHPVS